MEVHHAHHPLHTWKDFFVHIATITVGLLIAVGLEQCVEALHHRHQRHQLQEDLHVEAERNREIILKDLALEKHSVWLREAISHAADSPRGGKLSFVLPLTPCLPGVVGTQGKQYLAPSEAVWTTAKESGLAALLPVEEARIYARISHNDDLLAANHDRLAERCDTLSSMETRFAHRSADGQSETWTMNPEQAELFGAAAAQADTALRALVMRLHFTLGYEEAVVRGVHDVDQMMDIVNQQR